MLSMLSSVYGYTSSFNRFQFPALSQCTSCTACTSLLSIRNLHFDSRDRFMAQGSGALWRVWRRSGPILQGEGCNMHFGVLGGIPVVRPRGPAQVRSRIMHILRSCVSVCKEQLEQRLFRRPVLVLGHLYAAVHGLLGRGSGSVRICAPPRSRSV